MKSQAKILLFLVLFSYTSLKEFLRLPYVLIHFAYHNEGDSSMDLLDFVTVHYLEKAIPDDDHPQDMQLPFKSLTESCLFHNLFQIPSHQVHLQFAGKYIELNKSDFNYLVFATSPHFRGVFHPPQSTT